MDLVCGFADISPVQLVLVPLIGAEPVVSIVAIGRATASGLIVMPGNDAVPHGHFTSGGIDDRIESTLPPVFRPKIVPLS